MSVNLIGQFYFKRTTIGNLIGEFSNNMSNANSTESSDLVTYIDGFKGEYYSSWQENGKVLFAKLKIDDKLGCKDIFTLTWERNGTTIFWGEGFLCDNILIGHYRNFQVI